MVRLGTVLVALLLLAGCSSPPAHAAARPTPTAVPTPTPLPTLTGHLYLVARGATFTSGACEGTGGYSDIADGAPVNVKDQVGTVIGTSRLESGTTAPDGRCEFLFTVRDIPPAKFYQVEVSHRGGLTYSYADMVSRNWLVEMDLGS